MPQEYAKPHRSLQEQLALMKSRELSCSDDAHALAVLRAAGYYRLSAYVYPFRELIPEALQTSPRQFRSDTLQPGTTFAQVESLWRFDRELRLTWLDGLETIEVGIRTQLAYVVGRHDRYGHLHEDSLNEKACAKLVPSNNGGKAPGFKVWIDRYQQLRRQSKLVDFVAHHLCKYGDPIPIWKAVEFLDFGSLVRLFGLLRQTDQNEIALDLGIRNGNLLYKFLLQLSHVRNMVAHHSRLWNATLTYKVGYFPPESLDASLAHASNLGKRDKVYIPLAVTAYLTQKIDPETRWTGRLRELVSNFPEIPGMTPSTDMGFPENWQNLSLWGI